MAQRPIKIPRRGEQFSAHELRRLSELLEQLDREIPSVSQSGGVGGRQSSSGRTMDNLHYEPFWVQLTAKQANAYGWVELYETDPVGSPGTFSTLTNGRAGGCPLIISGTITGTTVALASTTGLVPNQTVSGTGVTSSPPTYILSVDSPTQITLTQAATNGTVTLTFGTNMAPAYEVNANVTPVGTNVQVWIGDTEELYFFRYNPASGGGTTTNIISRRMLIDEGVEEYHPRRGVGSTVIVGPPNCPRYGVRTRKTASSVTINPATNYVIPWDQEDVDTDSMWSAGSPTRWTINHTGKYIIFYQIDYTGPSNNTGQLAMQFLKNGTVLCSQQFDMVGFAGGQWFDFWFDGGYLQFQAGTSPAAFTAGDYIECRISFTDVAGGQMSLDDAYGGAEFIPNL